MWFRLAALWGRTVREAQAACGMDEFWEWCAYYTLEPWGGRADDWRFGVLASLLDQVYGAWVKDYKPRDPDKFFPNLAGRASEEVAQANADDEAAILQATFKAWVVAGGGEVLDQGGRPVAE